MSQIEWISHLPEEEGAMLAFALYKCGIETKEDEFRSAWQLFIRLRAAAAAITIKRALERELDEFQNVIERAVGR